MCGARRGRVWLGACALALLATAHAAAPAPSILKDSLGQATISVGQVVERSRAALGGRALLRLQGYALKGDLEGLSGFPGTYRLVAAAPNRRRLDWDIHYLSQTRAFDGHSGWERNATVRELAGDELRRLERASLLSPVLAIPGTIAHELAYLAPCGEGRNRCYVVRFADVQGWREAIAFDSVTFLPLEEARSEPYEDGFHEHAIRYGDYRRVGDVRLPFRIDETAPDLSFHVHVLTYELSRSAASDLFANPNAAHLGDPYELTLATLPRHVYRETRNVWADDRFWGMNYPLEEEWLFHLVVGERYGRFIAPTSLSTALYADQQLIESIELDATALERLRRFPVARFNPQSEIYNFRQAFTTPQALKINRIVYTFRGRTPTGQTVAQSLEVPVREYRPTHALIFPVRGNFIAINGHESDELNHSYEASQYFAYDIVPLGPGFEMRSPDGSFYAFAHTEVVAPADGIVVYARNDVPDGTVKQDYLKMEDGIWAIGGNIVLIDHGDGEFSLLAHMHQGSVRVRKGERVHQGDLIGLIGMSGSPGHPHLHYQLQDNPGLFVGDGLPATFINVKPAGWYEDGPLLALKRGVYARAE